MLTHSYFPRRDPVSCLCRRGPRPARPLPPPFDPPEDILMRLAPRTWLCLAVLLASPLAAALADEPKDEHWAFRAPRRPELPKVKDAGRVRNPIDRFILARLEKEGLAPSPEADRVTLIRRLSLD